MTEREMKFKAQLDAMVDAKLELDNCTSVSRTYEICEAEHKGSVTVVSKNKYGVESTMTINPFAIDGHTGYIHVKVTPMYPDGKLEIDSETKRIMFAAAKKIKKN